METMRDGLLGAAARYGGRVAVRCGDAARTYSEVVERSCRLANALSGLGLVPGDRVAILVEDQIESMEPYFACAIGGLVAVTVNRRLAPREIHLILADSDPRAMVLTSGLSDIVEGLDLASQVTLLVIGSGARPTGALSYEDELSRASGAAPGYVVQPSDPFMIAYTSGTTGVPKGAVLAHGRQLTATLVAASNLGIRPYGETAFSGSVSYPGAMTGHVYSSLITGGSVRIFGKLDPDEWFARMAADRSTFTYVASPLIPQFLELGRKYPTVIENLATVMHGAGPARRELLAELIDMCGPKFLETWGMTETGGASLTVTSPFDRLPGCLADDPVTTVGRNTPITRIFTVDDEGQELPPGSGHTGELVAECSTMFLRYWNKPEETAAVLRGTRYATGDLGVIDAHGYCYLTGGRRSEMIITGGMNVYPLEVEQILLEHDAVADAAVFGRSDDRWGEAVTAAVQLHPGATVTETDLIAFAQERLSGFKKPTRIHLVDDMPRTASMKIKKYELKARFTPQP